MRGDSAARIDALALRLAPHYSRFKVAERLLFTGHSHQAWPDAAERGLQQSFDVAAMEVDEKWDVAMQKAEVLRAYLRRWYEDPEGRYCLAPNTHQLLVSWLSALDLPGRPHLVTTDGEFHSMYRQLQRLSEAGVALSVVPVQPLDSLGSRVLAACHAQTSAVMLSSVFFESSLRNPHLREIATSLRDRAIPMLIDDYHGTNVAPLSLKALDLLDCYLVTGGYKYLQWGEGNCFLRYPADCRLRPAITGWYSAFSALPEPRRAQAATYDEGDWRFASATYDPASQFRAAAVVEFFESEALDAATLHAQSQRQVGRLRESLLAADLDPKWLAPVHQQPLASNGGFLALRSPRAGDVHVALGRRGVHTDVRGDILRLGPAPYISAGQIDAAIAELRECVRGLQGRS